MTEEEFQGHVDFAKGMSATSAGCAPLPGSHAWCAWCGKWGDHTSGGCKDLALQSRVAGAARCCERLVAALRLIASQNCASKSDIKEMVATMRRIARDAIESYENTDLCHAANQV